MRPPDEDRPGDPKIPGATHHLDDQTATKQPGADCNPSADSPGAVEIGFAEPQPRTRSKSPCPRKGTSRREH
jgi:hypothetical protein